MEHEFGGKPYDLAAKAPASPYKRFSPHTKVENWKTPTLVIHGAKDYRLVETEGIATFQALQRQGVPSQFLFLPTENHWCLNPQHSLIWHDTVLTWITDWTGPEATNSPGAIWQTQKRVQSRWDPAL